MVWEWIPPTVVALLVLLEAWRARSKVQKMHMEVDGRLTQLLEAVRSEARGVGHAAGVLEERERSKEKEGPADDVRGLD